MEKTEIIKARPAIQITGHPTVIQRKTWNVLLAHAYDNLPTQEIHSINLSELSKAIGYESRNYEYFKHAVGGLSECTVEWNISEEERWGKASLLAEVEIKDGVCSYAYSPTMRKFLHTPAIYAKLNLEIQSKFSSKYALTLWELCCDYKKVKSTGWIELEKFKEILGVPHITYKNFKPLNSQVIKPAINEVNKHSEFHVTVEFERFKRCVAKVRLLIHDKEVATAQESDEKQPVANRKKADPTCKICQGTGWEFVESNVTRYCKCTYA